MKKLSCRIGLHNWYRGAFVSPVYGRYERHCLDCDKKQFSKWDKTKHKRTWETFK